ncbi:MAG: nagA [Paenibacillus sp.]|nr:nagA [Paenibacillus sp.]
MTGLHHRNPGTVGAVMSDDRIRAEIIADGHHVHPACIRLLTKTKTDDNLIMITDAMSAAGLEDGIYDLGGLAVNVSGGVATLKEGNSLAGSTLTMIGALRYVTDNVGVTVPQASRYMSGNPARQLGIFDRTGSLEAGKQADVLLVSPDLELQRIWVLGNEIEPFRG